MNWGRAKSILIVSFLCLNILLGYQFWASRSGQDSSKTDLVWIKEETAKLLTIKNIRIQADVPQDTPKLSQITVKIQEEYRNAKPYLLTEPVKYARLLNKNALKDVIAKIPIEHGDSYLHDPISGEEGIHVLNQVAGDWPMFDITLELFEEKGLIIGFKQAYVEVQSGGDSKEQKVISAYTAIRSLAESVLREGAVITEVRLGYHGQKFDSETQVMLPTWRATLADGSFYYVQAFTGDVEGKQSLPLN